jgi:tetratricopeptide (TPR) repeat protein/transcriptional regulator with XRE-family HTH domain
LPVIVMSFCCQVPASLQFYGSPAVITMKKGRSLSSRVEASPGHPESLGLLLRRHRVDRLLSLEDLAALSGISDRALSDIERGVSVAPRRRTLLGLIAALGLTEGEAAAFLRVARSSKDAARNPSRTVLLQPRRLHDYTGRTTEMTAILSSLAPEPDGLVRTTPVVVIHGAPGMGKTTTAIEALNRWRGDRPAELFADLDGLGASPLTPLQVLQVLLKQVLGDSRKIPTDPTAAAALWREVSADAPGGVLLDNAGTEAQVRPVLAAARRGAVVITSRRSLAGLEGVRRHHLGALAPADSLQLLMDLTRLPQHDEDSLARLAELCSHIPLALRIAGNRIASQPSWTVSDFLSRLAQEERRLRTLVAGDLAVEAAFNLSYHHLATQHRSLFRHLALLQGPTFSAPLAAAAAGQDLGDAEDGLDELIDLGLVQAVTGNRYRLHDLMRIFATQCLRDEETSEATDDRRRVLRQWLLAVTISAGNWFEPDPAPAPPLAGVRIRFTDTDQARQWLYTEAPHWYAAYQDAAARQEHQLVIQVAESLHWFSDLWIGWGNWCLLYSQSAAAAEALEDDLLTATHLGYVAWAQLIEIRDPGTALATARRALEAADRAGDDDQRGWAESYISSAHRALGQLTEALRASERCTIAFDAAGDTEGKLQALVAQVTILERQGRHRESITRSRELLTSLETADIPPIIKGFNRSVAWATIAQVHLNQGHHDDAIDSATEALHAAEAVDSRLGIADARHLRGQALISMNKPDEARADFEQALHHAETAGDRALAATLRDLLA